MGWLNDLLDTKVADTSNDPVGQEMEARRTQRAADTERLRTDEANREAIDKAQQDSILIPQGQYMPTEDDKAAGKYAVDKGIATQEQVNDPYNLRGGKPISSPTDAGEPLGPAAPTPEQAAAMKAPPVLTPDAVAAAKPAMARSSFARGGSPGQQVGGPTGDGDSLDAPTKIEDDTHKALVASGVSPQLAAMLADQKKRQDQLKEGQGAQLSARNAADEIYAMRAGFGIRGADEMHRSALASADLRASNVKDLQAAGDQGLEQGEKLRSFTRALDMDDPGSQISQQVAQITGHKGVPASLYPQIADKLKASASAAEKKADLKQRQSEESGRTARQQMQDETELEKERMRLRAAQAKGPKSPEMVAQQEKQLSDIRSARTMIQKLDADMESKGVSGWGSGLSALLSRIGIDTDAGEVDARARIASRVQGRGIEGGKFSDQDAAFYESVGAKASDARELQRAKNRAALQRLDEAEKQIIGTSQEAGRNTGRLQAQSSGVGLSAADAPVGTRRPGPGGKMFRKVGPGQWQAE